MKGTPQFPMCGFSSRTAQALKEAGAQIPRGQRAGGSGNSRRPAALSELADVSAAVHQRRIDRRLRHRASSCTPAANSRAWQPRRQRLEHDRAHWCACRQGFAPDARMRSRIASSWSPAPTAGSGDAAAGPARGRRDRGAARSQGARSWSSSTTRSRRSALRSRRIYPLDLVGATPRDYAAAGRTHRARIRPSRRHRARGRQFQRTARRSPTPSRMTGCARMHVNVTAPFAADAGLPAALLRAGRDSAVVFVLDDPRARAARVLGRLRRVQGGCSALARRFCTTKPRTAPVRVHALLPGADAHRPAPRRVLRRRTPLRAAAAGCAPPTPAFICLARLRHRRAARPGFRGTSTTRRPGRAWIAQQGRSTWKAQMTHAVGGILLFLIMDPARATSRSFSSLLEGRGAASAAAVCMVRELLIALGVLMAFLFGGSHVLEGAAAAPGVDQHRRRHRAVPDRHQA